MLKPINLSLAYSFLERKTWNNGVGFKKQRHESINKYQNILISPTETYPWFIIEK